MLITPADLSLPPSFAAFRPGQDETIIRIAESPRRFTLLSAPTGTGKSLIYVSVSRMLQARCLILVSTKALLDQLMRDFRGIGLYKILGHTNYPCASTLQSDFGADSDFECTPIDGGECAYRAAVGVCLTKDITCTTYAHWITLQKSADPLRLGRFDYLVCDEAHLVMDQVVAQVAIQLRESSVRGLIGLNLPKANRFSGATIPIPTCREWAAEARQAALDKYYALRGEDEHTQSAAVRKQLARLTRLGLDLRRFIDESARHEWIAQTTGATMPRQGSARVLDLSPVWAAPYAESYLFRSTPNVLLCSATLAESESKYLSIAKGTSQYLELDSSFAADRRPVIYCPTSPAIRVDYRITDGEFRMVVNRIDSIIDARLDRKGIIHTRSYARARDIAALSRHSAHMLTHDSASARATVERFKRAAAPCILVSPSVEEGHDFPGDECLWIIIVKVPFLDGRDPMIAARKRTVKSYPAHVTSQTLIQMAGRAVRSATDAAECFIVDAHFAHFSKSGDFPKWFKHAFSTAYVIPPPIDINPYT